MHTIRISPFRYCWYVAQRGSKCKHAGLPRGGGRTAYTVPVNLTSNHTHSTYCSDDKATHAPLVKNYPRRDELIV